MTSRTARRTRIGLLVVGCLSGSVGAAAGQTTPILKHDYVNVNGVRLHYVTTGTGPRANRSGPPTPGQDTRLSVLPADNVKLEGPSIVKVPTLVIWGEKDLALLPQNLDGLQQFVPRLTVKRIQDGSHWVVHEKPTQVNAYIREFIQ